MDYKRMSVPLPDVRQAARVNHVARRIHMPSGDGRIAGGNVRLDFPNTPRFWRMTRMPNPASYYNNRDFTRVRQASNLVTSEAQVSAILQKAAEIATRLESMKGTLSPVDEMILTGELDSWKKITVQLGHYPGDILASPSPVALASMPNAWVQIAIKLARLYPDEPLQTPLARTPMNTNGSCPCYVAGFPAKLASAALFQPTAADTMAFSEEVMTRLGLPFQTALAYGYNDRTGPLAKWVRLWKRDDLGNWFSDEEGISLHTRRRLVFMGAMPGILGTRKLAATFKTGRKSLPGLWHEGDTDAQTGMKMHFYRARGWVMKEADISAFDTSVNPTMQSTLAEIFRKRWPHYAEEVDFWYLAENLPLLGPSYLADPGQRSGATLITTHGGTKSGHLLTAEIGTFIAMTTLLYGFYKMGYRDPIASWLQGEILILDQGDDQLFCAERLDPSAIEDAYSEVGLTVKIIDGCRFLSKHVTPDGLLPVAGRIAQQTCFNEWEPTGRNLIGINVLGVRERWGRGPAFWLRDVTRDMIGLTNLSQLGINDGPSADDWLKSPVGRDALSTALRTVAGSSYVDKIRRDAPYSSTAAALLQALLAAGADLSKEAGYDDLGWQLIDELAPASRERRFQIIHEIFKWHGELDARSIEHLTIKLMKGEINDRDRYAADAGGAAIDDAA